MRAAWRLAFCVVLCLLVCASAAQADTVNNFNDPGTPYTLTKHKDGPGPVVTGGVARLTTSGYQGQVNSLVFDRVDVGPFDTELRAEFDFKFSDTTGVGADGIGFLLVPTALYGTTGSAGIFHSEYIAEDPNLAGCLGVGFDISYNSGRDPNNNHVSMHWDNARLATVDMGPLGITLESAAWIHAEITVRPVAGGSNVGVTVTKDATVATPFSDYFIAGLNPYEYRVALVARSGADTITAEVDNLLVQSSATLQPPIAVDDAYRGLAGQMLTVAAPGVLENDHDPNSDPISAALVETTSNGQLWLYPNGSFVYIPNAGFVGVDTFTYQATNGLGEISETATVTITVESIKVTALSPAPEALLSVGPGSIVATFNTGVNPGTVNTATFLLVRSGGDAIFGNGNDVAITPVSAAATGATEATMDLTGVTLPEDAYQVTLVGTGGTPITNVLGNVLDGEFTGTFPSGDGPEGGDFVATFSVDADPPTVLSTSPSDGAANVAVSADVEMTFSEPMDHASAEAAFSISGGVTGTFSWVGNTMTFHPTPSLDDDTAYTVTISTDAQDWLGRAMAAPYVFAFTTADAYPTGTPLPAGYVKRMLHLGAQESDRITDAIYNYEIEADYFTHAKLGPEYGQQPSHGQAADLSPSPTTQSPMVWTDLTDGDADGIWCENVGSKYVMYWALYVIAPSTREVKINSIHDDEIRGWLDGDPNPVVDHPGAAVSTSNVFTLTAGVHCFIFKLHEHTGGDQLAVKFLHPDDSNMTDLAYALVDPIRPRVRETWPAEGAADVPRWNDVIITFREPMDTTVDPATVAEITGGSAIGTWSWTSPVHLTWTPASPLAASATYTVTVSRANARDLVGHTLSGVNVFTFTTTAASQPIVTATVPDSGDSGDALFGVDLSGLGFIEGGIIHPPGAVPFAGHYYLYFRPAASWHDARDACEAEGGYLATISSEEEDTFVWGLAGRRRFWLGMSDEAQEGNWVWVNGEPVVYTNWASGEPNNHNNQDVLGRRPYGWDDYGITISHTYVCEFDVRTRPSVHLAMTGEDDIVGSNLTLVDSGHLTFDLDLADAAAGDWDVVVTNPDGATFVLPNGFLIQGPPPHIEALELFYNGQFGDAADPAKMFLAVGEASSMSLVGTDLFGNVTNYLHGVTGIRVTFDTVVTFSVDAAAAFSYETTPEQSTDKTFTPFAPPTAPVYTVDNGSGKTVVTITFADGEIKNRWLKTIVDASQVSANGMDLDGELPSPLTLPSGDGTAGGNAEFIIGHRFGDVDGNYRCLLNDAVLVRNQVSGTVVVGISNAYEVDKNERVLLNDAILARNAVSGIALPALP